MINLEDREEFLGQTIDIFEDFLDEHGIKIENPERDKDDDDNNTNIWGNDYDELAEELRCLFEYWGIIPKD